MTILDVGFTAFTGFGLRWIFLNEFLFDENKLENESIIAVNQYVNVVKPTSKIIMKDKSQQQIDEILDKISKSGYDSLSSSEKEFLFKAGNS